MPTITKENAIHHCRTCLKHLGRTACEETASKYKEHSINIGSDAELNGLIGKYVDEYSTNSPLEELPKQVCLHCYNKFIFFERFRQRVRLNARKLLALFKHVDGVYKLEIDDENEDSQQPLVPELREIDTVASDHNNMYNFILKDSLMETEYVIVNDSSMAPLMSVETQNPDPFDAATPCEKNIDLPIEKDCAETESDWQMHKAPSASESEIDSLEARLKSEPMKVRNLHRKCTKRTIYKNASKVKNKPSPLEKMETKVENRSAIKLERLETESHATTRSTSTAAKANNPRKRKRRSKSKFEELQEPEENVSENASTDADILDNKMKRRHRGTKNKFKCIQCNHSFAHKITLDAHVRKVHEGSKRPFQCDRCDKSYRFIGGLYTHIKEIHEVEIRSYSCDFPDCGRIYTSFIAMQKHKRLKHTDTPSIKKYVCEQCGATFNQSGNLKYHRRTKHPTDAEQAEKEKSKERYQCELCQKFFHSRYTLKYHTLQLHTNDTKYECTVCGRRMAKKFMLVQHMLVHSTDKMPCEQCGRQFIRKFELEAHIRAVHMKLKPFECQYCSECFASRKTLRHHEYIHTGEKPYVCEICGQAYRQQTCLKNHRKSHEKTYAQSGENTREMNITGAPMNTLLTPCIASDLRSIRALDIPINTVLTVPPCNNCISSSANISTENIGAELAKANNSMPN